MESLCSTFSQVSASVPKVASCHGGFHSNTLKSSRLRGPHLQAQFPSSSIGRPRTFHITCAASTSTAEKEPEKREQTVSIKDIGNSLAPSSFEVQNLLMEICDETSVAEFKLKVGDFKLHIKRDAGKLKGSTPHPVVAPPIPSKPMEESMTTAVSSLVVSQPASKPSSSPSTELLSSSVFKSGSRFGLLEAAANEGLHFVTSPKVGLFRKARVVKGKSGRSLCEEGQIVKEGQVVCYIEQLGTQQPVEAENSGEIMKILCKDGEPVGYGDPLVAIRPSFPGIK